MSRTTAIAGASFVLFLFLVALAGCGGDVKSPSPAPTTPAATPAPPSGGGSTPAPSTAAMQWSESMGSSAFGTGSNISIDTNGNVTIKLAAAGALRQYDVRFCPYPYIPAPNECFSLNQTVIADANGAATSTFHFPKSGAWSGNFYLVANAGSSNQTSFSTGDNLGGTMEEVLVPGSGVNNGPASPYPQDPLNSGTLKVASRSVTVTLNGAVPNAHYGIIEAGGGSQSYYQATLSTDASGNGTATFAALSRPGGDFSIFRLAEGSTTSAANAGGYYAGFKVP